MRRLLLVPAFVMMTLPGVSAQPAVPPLLANISDAKFRPVDPARPDGHAIAVLRGDPANGPSDVLLKMKKTDGTPHTHTSAYRAVLVRGEAMHYEKCTCEAAGSLEPGSYWYQPGGVLHGDACLSEECIIFVSWEGKMDVTVPQAPAPK